MVLFPGQTLPMTVFGAHTVNMLQKCIQENRTFGVICAGIDKKALIGTTAEIYEYIDSTQGFCIKAKGRQRFKILNATPVIVSSYLKILL